MKNAKIITPTAVENKTKSKTKSYAPIVVRAMKYKQIKDLRDKGLDPNFNLDASDDQTTLNRMVDWIISNVYHDEPNIGEYEYHQLLELATDTYRRAYQGPETI